MLALSILGRRERPMYGSTIILREFDHGDCARIDAARRLGHGRHDSRDRQSLVRRLCGWRQGEIELGVGVRPGVRRTAFVNLLDEVK